MAACFVSLLLLSASAHMQDSCDYTLDSAKNKAGMIRGGNYFTSTATISDVAGCASFCCNTGGCRSFSLDIGWGMKWLGCVAGKPCCALNKGLGPFEVYHGPMNVTTGVVHAQPSTGKPPGVNSSFDCAMRELAYEYARSLRPDKGNFSTVYDALQLSRCGVALTRYPNPGFSGGGPAAVVADSMEYFVSTNNGSDSASGTLIAPFATPQRGIAACRDVSSSSSSSFSSSFSSSPPPLRAAVPLQPLRAGDGRADAAR
jgi:hypothetical protein